MEAGGSIVCAQQGVEGSGDIGEGLRARWIDPAKGAVQWQRSVAGGLENAEGARVEVGANRRRRSAIVAPIGKLQDV